LEKPTASSVKSLYKFMWFTGAEGWYFALALADGVPADAREVLINSLLQALDELQTVISVRGEFVEP
jgi:hypothetical protein